MEVGSRHWIKLAVHEVVRRGVAQVEASRGARFPQVDEFLNHRRVRVGHHFSRHAAALKQGAAEEERE
jgi:hypothetical protein